MPRAIKLLVTFLALLTFSHAYAAQESSQQYVSEDIGIVMRSGPTSAYRVIGRIMAGAPIEVLSSDVDNQTSQVKTRDNKTGWIATSYITSSKSAQVLLQDALAENDKLLESNNQLNYEISDKSKIISENDSLNQQVSELLNKVEQLEQRANLGKDRFRTDMFFAGGVTVLVSMLIAWVLTRIAYGRRKKSGWR